MKINKELSKKFQTTFEAVAPTYLDFTKNKEYDYQDHTTQSFWLGFMLAEQHNLSNNSGLRKTHFVVGRLNEKGSPRFSQRPFLHSSKTKAVLEAEKLSLNIKTSAFGIYRLDDVVINGNLNKIKIYTIHWKDRTQTLVKGIDFDCALTNSGFDINSVKENIAWYDNGITYLYEIIWKEDGSKTYASGPNSHVAISMAGVTKFFSDIPDMNLGESYHKTRSKIKSCSCISSLFKRVQTDTELTVGETAEIDS